MAFQSIDLPGPEDHFRLSPWSGAERLGGRFPMKVVMAGQGAFGVKHLEAMQKIPDVEVVSLVGGSPDTTKAVAERFNIPHWTGDLAEALAQPGVDAAILATPTQMHASQALLCLKAGKHVQV